MYQMEGSVTMGWLLTHGVARTRGVKVRVERSAKKPQAADPVVSRRKSAMAIWSSSCGCGLRDFETMCSAAAAGCSRSPSEQKEAVHDEI